MLYRFVNAASAQAVRAAPIASQSRLAARPKELGVALRFRLPNAGRSRATTSWRGIERSSSAKRSFTFAEQAPLRVDQPREEGTLTVSTSLCANDSKLSSNLGCSCFWLITLIACFRNCETNGSSFRRDTRMTSRPIKMRADAGIPELPSFLQL